MKLSDNVCRLTAQFWGNCLRERLSNITNDSPLKGEFSDLAKRVHMQRLRAVIEDPNQVVVFETVLTGLLAEVEVGYPNFSYTLRINYTDSECNSPELFEACRLAGIDPLCLPWKTATFSSAYNGIQYQYRNGDRQTL